ncbi:hypothetical protein HYW84_03390 [Candidatus Peregrinibacteria bacterium]|nr:hypothetical protein [Candidatus Peregrinibacteria bacterium]
MRILFCDTASHDGMIACVTDDKIAALDSIDHRIDDAGLVSRIEAMLTSAKWTYHDFTHIACVIGPGGFMSLRTAVALVNVMSHELDIPVCGIHLSDMYFARMPLSLYRLPAKQEIRAAWLHSTKRFELFIRGFGSLKEKFPEPQRIAAGDLKHAISAGTRWTGELISEHRAIVAGTGAEEIRLETKEDTLPVFLKAQSYKKQTLQPWYGREW